jgi:hypothetical protein
MIVAKNDIMVPGFLKGDLVRLNNTDVIRRIEGVLRYDGKHFTYDAVNINGNKKDTHVRTDGNQIHGVDDVEQKKYMDIAKPFALNPSAKPFTFNLSGGARDSFKTTYMVTKHRYAKLLGTHS